jgi:predicted house-cleaning NTP pyrophosphatase (Maf/HAM1 superfamily)
VTTFFILASSSKSRLVILNKLSYQPDLVLSPEIVETKHRSEKPKDLSIRLSKQKAFKAYNDIFAKSSTKKVETTSVKKFVILSADTVCAIGREVVDKAMTKEDVKSSLTSLSGKNHRVYTSICLLQVDLSQAQEVNDNYNLTADANKHSSKSCKFYNKEMNFFDINYLQSYIKDYRFFNLKDNLPSFIKISSKCVETRIKFKKLSDDEIENFANSGEGLYNAGGYTISGVAESFIISLIGSYSSVIGLPSYQTISLLKAAGVDPKQILYQ